MRYGIDKTETQLQVIKNEITFGNIQFASLKDIRKRDTSKVKGTYRFLVNVGGVIVRSSDFVIGGKKENPKKKRKT